MLLNIIKKKITVKNKLNIHFGNIILIKNIKA